MLRISKRKLDDECDKGNLRRNVIGNRAYYKRYDVETDEERDYRCWLNAQYHHLEDRRTA